MSKNATILIYHHGDLDGICAAAVVSKRFSSCYTIKPVSVQYGDSWNLEDVEQAAKVFVVDFSFSDMETLAKVAGDKLVWIDHHKTAMETFTELWNSDIDGIRSIEFAGCELTWKYCYYLRQPPLPVKYIGDRDMWNFAYPDTKTFCAGINAMIDSPLDKNWGWLLEYGMVESSLIDIINMGKYLIKAQEAIVKTRFYSGSDIEFCGHKTRVVNATSDISELGEYINSNGYDLALIWQVCGDKVKYSLRSKTVDCSEIAKKYGGGGHQGAAGFTISNKYPFPQLVL